jgi:hypothetical protein
MLRIRTIKKVQKLIEIRKINISDIFRNQRWFYSIMLLKIYVVFFEAEAVQTKIHKLAVVMALC